MKKNELTNLQIGSKVESKKTGEVLIINNIVEVEGKVKYELDNNKTVAQSSMLRWYNLVEQEVVEQVEIETPAVEVEPTPEELQQLIEKEAKTVKLTDLEKEAMLILRDNEYENCFDNSFFHNPPTWDFVIIEGLSCGVQGAKGVLGSLTKKGLVVVDTEGEYNKNSKQYDRSVALTDLGYEVGKLYFESIGQTTEYEGRVEPEEIQPAQQPVEPQPEVKPVEVKPIDVKPANNLAEQIFEYCNNHQDIYTIKHNKDHSVIKGVNKKNLVEIYASKKAVNVAVRQDLYTEEEQMVLDNARIVGNGTFTLDLKFVVHSINDFISVLNRATQYVPPKKSRK